MFKPVSYPYPGTGTGTRTGTGTQPAGCSTLVHKYVYAYVISMFVTCLKEKQVRHWLILANDLVFNTKPQ